MLVYIVNCLINNAVSSQEYRAEYEEYKSVKDKPRLCLTCFMTIIFCLFNFQRLNLGAGIMRMKHFQWFMQKWFWAFSLTTNVCIVSRDFPVIIPINTSFERNLSLWNLHRLKQLLSDYTGKWNFVSALWYAKFNNFVECFIRFDMSHILNINHMRNNAFQICQLTHFDYRSKIRGYYHVWEA